MAVYIKKISLAIVIVLVLSAESIYAESLAKPIDTKNTFILYLSHLFMPAEGSSAPENGDNDISVNVIESNTIFDMYHFAEQGKQGIYDLETTSVYLNYIRRIDERTFVKAVLPYYYHSGGFMDESIENFHNAFPGGGLKNGGREYTEDNEIHIQYQTAEGGPDINGSFQGMGDPSFFIKRILSDSGPGITFVAGIKPGIGNEAFINSNTTDLGINLNADYAAGRFYFYGMAGCSWFFGDGFYKKELEQTRDCMLSSAAGAGVTFFGSLYFSIQFYIHNSLYETEIDKIDYVTIINSYTLRWRMNEQLLLQFSFDEDPITYASADIAFSLRCEYTF